MKDDELEKAAEAYADRNSKSRDDYTALQLAFLNGYERAKAREQKRAERLIGTLGSIARQDNYTAQKAALAVKEYGE